MRFFCLVNAASGAGQGNRLLAKLTQLARLGVFQGECAALDFKNFASQIERARSFDALLVGGGDGSVSRAAAALAGGSLPIGILPLGVGNDLAKELGIYRLFSPRNPELLLRRYEHLHVKKFSLGTLTLADSRQIHFTKYHSLGFDAEAVVLFSALRERYPWMAETFGHFASLALYGWSGLARCRNRLPDAITVRNLSDGHSFEIGGKKALLFSNIRSYTGLGKACRNASPFDDRLECSIFSSLAEYIQIFLRSPKEASASNAGFEIIANGPPLSFQLDGEPYPRAGTKRMIVSVKQSVPVLLP